MSWWPLWDRPWYEAVPWIVVAIVFGTWFGLYVAEWLLTRWDLTRHRRAWRPRNKQPEPWWKRLLRRLRLR